VYTTAFPAGTSRDLPLAVLSLLWHSSSVLYSGWSDVTESMITTLTPFCGYNMMKVRRVKRRRSIVVFPNKIEPVTLRKCRYDPWLTDRAYLIAITVTDISQSFTYTTAAKINRGIDTEQNYVTLTLPTRPAEPSFLCCSTWTGPFSF